MINKQVLLIAAQASAHHEVDISTVLGNSLTILVAFIVLMLILSKVALKPIMKLVEEREQTIHAQLDSADAVVKKAEETRLEAEKILKEAKESAQQILAQAHAESEQFKLTEQSRVKEEVAQLREEAHRVIENERQNVQRDLTNQLAATSSELAGRLLEREITPQDHQRLIDEFIEGLG